MAAIPAATGNVTYQHEVISYDQLVAFYQNHCPQKVSGLKHFERDRQIFVFFLQVSQSQALLEHFAGKHHLLSDSLHKKYNARPASNMRSGPVLMTGYQNTGDTIAWGSAQTPPAPASYNQGMAQLNQQGMSQLNHETAQLHGISHF